MVQTGQQNLGPDAMNPYHGETQIGSLYFANSTPAGRKLATSIVTGFEPISVFAGMSRNGRTRKSGNRKGNQTDFINRRVLVIEDDRFSVEIYTTL